MPRDFNDNFKDSADANLYFIIFIFILVFLLFYVAYNYLIIKNIDLGSPKGRCEAFCAGMGSDKLLGYIDEPGEFVKCICNNRPPRIDKMYIRKP